MKGGKGQRKKKTLAVGRLLGVDPAEGRGRNLREKGKRKEQPLSAPYIFLLISCFLKEKGSWKKKRKGEGEGSEADKIVSRISAPMKRGNNQKKKKGGEGPSHSAQILYFRSCAWRGGGRRGEKEGKDHPNYFLSDGGTRKKGGKSQAEVQKKEERGG